MRRLQPRLLNGPTVRLSSTPHHYTSDPQTATLSAARPLGTLAQTLPLPSTYRSTHHLRSPAIAQRLTTPTTPFPTSHIPHPHIHPNTTPLRGHTHSRTTSNPHNLPAADPFSSSNQLPTVPTSRRVRCQPGQWGLGLRRADVSGRRGRRGVRSCLEDWDAGRACRRLRRRWWEGSW